ncbi:MAG: DNA polymerase III subunit delta' [Isosphaeraceae bacterium]
MIRQLCHDLSLRPARGGRKVAIVDDGDDLNDEAANAFLKTLEEPPPGSVLILIASAAELMLETIVSRCRVLRFDPLSKDDLKQILLDLKVAGTAPDAEKLASLGEGSVSRAKGLADPAFIAFRRPLIDSLSRPEPFDAPHWARQIEAFVKEAGKEGILQRRRASLLAVELASFFRAVLWQTAGLSPSSPDGADQLAGQDLAQRLEPEDLLLLADRCMEADYQVQRNAGMGLLLDAWMLDLGKLIQKRR